jgi:hypothetical protein
MPAVVLTLAPIQWASRDIYQGVVRQGREANCSFRSCVEVKNDGVTPPLLIIFHGAMLN